MQQCSPLDKTQGHFDLLTQLFYMFFTGMVLLATNNSYRSVGTYSTSICDHYETHKNIFLYIMYCFYFSGYGRYATAILVESMNRCSFVGIIANVSEFINS